MPEGVLGVFAEPAQAAGAVRSLRAAGHEVRAAMPAPYPAVMAALARPSSPLGFYTLAGALLGGAAGLALTVGTSLDWPLIVGGKPIVSMPAFLVVVFEAMVLVGAAVNSLALVGLGVRGRRRRRVPEDPRFSRDRIGVFVPGAAVGAEDILHGGGAEEVRRVAA
ncbi:MAG TPA: quinol:electron acceptor oxidoreductase subunit ActD [Myxococcales bacterium]